MTGVAGRMRRTSAHPRPGRIVLGLGRMVAGVGTASIHPPGAAAVVAVVLGAAPAAAAVGATKQRPPDVLTIGAGLLVFATFTAVSITIGAGSPWQAWRWRDLGWLDPRGAVRDGCGLATSDLQPASAFCAAGSPSTH